MLNRNWKVDFSNNHVTVINQYNPKEKVSVQRKNGHIICVDIIHSTKPVNLTRVNTKMPYESHVAQEGGTLTWPMK